MLYSITHRTIYEYEADVAVSHHLAHLHPRELPHQHVLDFGIEVRPQASVTVTRRDFFGNASMFLSIESTHRELEVATRSRVRVTAPKLPQPALTPAWESARESCAGDVLTADTEAGEFRFDSMHVTRKQVFAAYAAASFRPGRPILEAVTDLIGRVFREFKFDPRATTVATPIEEVLEKRRGVCQDFAHFCIACLRSVGLPARYVSGYLETVPPPGKPRLVGADASHAWFAFWCPGHGWIDMDPTNNLMPADRHVTVAWGRDFSDVSPLRGVVIGGDDHDVEVAVDMEPLAEATISALHAPQGQSQGGQSQ